MSAADLAKEALGHGDPSSALALLQEAVRAKPEDAKLRVFLTQLLCVLGQWDRALTQLTMASRLDPSAHAMATTYGDAIRCEAVRAAVFRGAVAPSTLGESEGWLALLIESNLEEARGAHVRARDLRARAHEEAEPSSGTMNGRAFEWVADADERLGPVLEAIVNGCYYWIPFSRVARLSMEPPHDLRDMVWMPAQIEFADGRASEALLPARYPGSEWSQDGRVALARKTIWEVVNDEVTGLGQRVLATDEEEVPFLDIRTLTIDPPSHAERAAALSCDA